MLAAHCWMLAAGGSGSWWQWQLVAKKM